MRATRTVAGPASPVVLGLAVLGVSTYVLLTLAARAQGVERYSSFAIFWSVSFGVGIGVALPFEQEVSRRVARDVARGASHLRSLASAYRRAAVVGAAAALCLLALVPWASHVGVRSPWLLWLVTTLSVNATLGTYVARGALAGAGRWRSYGRQLAVEGLIRLAGSVVLSAAGVRSFTAWAALVVVSLVGGFLAAPVWAHRGHDDDPLRFGDEILPLVVATGLGQLLVNVGPLVVVLLGARLDAGDAARFLAALTIARVPVFAFAAVQPMVVTRLAASVAVADHRGFTQTLRSALGLVALGSSVYAVVCAAAGPWASAVLGPQFRLSPSSLVLCVLAMGLYLVTLVLQPALAVLGRHRGVAMSWLAATAVFLLACLTPVPPVRAVELALVAGCGTAATLLGAILLPARRPGSTRRG